MNHPLKSYLTALSVYEEFISQMDCSLQTQRSWLKEQIAELSKPEPKRYRCINNDWPFERWKIGQEIESRHTLKDLQATDVTLFPFHWELIEEEEVVTRTKAELIEPKQEYTYKQVYKDLESLGWAADGGWQRDKIRYIREKMKAQIERK